MPKRLHGPQPPRRSQDRSVNAVPVRERFLIICEGTRTEPLYFENFKVPGRVLSIVGTAMNTLSLVEEAIRWRDMENARLQNRRQEGFDQCWCVFDRDSFPSGNFNSAIERAQANGFRVAYSNVAFELWYLLHFDFHQSAISREQYREKLTECLGYRYEKNSRPMYNILLPRQETAIRNATALINYHNSTNPEQNNPSTTVHELVLQLNKSIDIR